MVAVQEFRRQLMALDEARNRYRAALLSQIMMKEAITPCTKDIPALHSLVESTLRAHYDMLVDGLPLLPEPVVSGVPQRVEDRLNFLMNKESKQGLSLPEKQEYRTLLREEMDAPRCPSGLISCLTIITSVLSVGGAAAYLTTPIREFVARNFLPAALPELGQSVTQIEAKGVPSAPPPQLAGRWQLRPDAVILMPSDPRLQQFANIPFAQVNTWLQTMWAWAAANFGTDQNSSLWQPETWLLRPTSTLQIAKLQAPSIASPSYVESSGNTVFSLVQYVSDIQQGKPIAQQIAEAQQRGYDKCRQDFTQQSQVLEKEVVVKQLEEENQKLRADLQLREAKHNEPLTLRLAKDVIFQLDNIPDGLNKGQRDVAIQLRENDIQTLKQTLDQGVARWRMNLDEIRRTGQSPAGFYFREPMA